MSASTLVRAVSAAALAIGLAAVPALAQEKVLRVITSADLKNIDPIWTTAGITLAHGYMIYDKLYEFDSNRVPRPQMAASHTVSPDGLVYTITLRDGLVFHDGAPVTAKDVVQSLKRWSKRDALGQTMASVTKDWEAVDAKTLRITLSEPFGLVLDALAGIRGNPPFIMPERVAMTDPGTQITDATGSGPFTFDLKAWKPGDKVVYRKFDKYVPRAEPSDFYAGGKVVHFDRVEKLYIPDASTAMAALIAGEVDHWELPPPDLANALRSNPDIEVTRGTYFHGVVRPNHLQPPFDNEKARQALFYLMDQNEALTAAVGSPALWQVCPAFLTCGGPYSSTAGTVGVVKADIEKAKALLKEGGYDGRPIIVLDPTDFADLHAVSLYMAQQLRKAGARVEVQSMDWSTLTSRRTNKGPTSAGGWNLMPTYTGGLEASSPLTNVTLATSCDKAWFGWPCDPVIEDLKVQWRREADPARRKALAEQMQVHAYKVVPYVPYGQFFNTSATRKSVKDLIPETPIGVYWNVRKG